MKLIIFFRNPNESVLAKGSTTSGFAPNNIANGYFHRGGFRASAGSRYSDWMGGSTGIGSSTHSQVSSFAPISSLSSKTATSTYSANQQPSNANGGKKIGIYPVLSLI